jgi:hypothetical protein
VFAEELSSEFGAILRSTAAPIAAPLFECLSKGELPPPESGVDMVRVADALVLNVMTREAAESSAASHGYA